MAQLFYLNLSGNQIGDEGMKSFSKVLVSGAMAQLKNLFVENPSVVLS
jgi:Ran GTPase-activating protein (RanGAP) involved in mRNA processing and transport